MIDEAVRYPPVTPPSNLSMLLGMHEKLRMICHGYGRMVKVTHEMQPRFIHGSTLSPILCGFYFHFDGGRMVR
jgi:hypothetical protein